MIYSIAHKNLVLHGLTWGFETWRLGPSMLFHSSHFSKILKNKNFLNQFHHRLKLRINHTPLTLYEHENLSYKAHFEAFFSEHSGLRLLSSKDTSQSPCASVPQTGTGVQELTQRFWGPHSKNVCRHKKYVTATKRMQHVTAFLSLARVTCST